MFDFITSDLHLDDPGILKYGRAHFKNRQNMNEFLIQNWNNKISKNDTTLVLGDIIRSDGDYDLLHRLNGKIILIKGNHDGKSQFFFNRGILVFDQIELTLCGIKVRFCHYPYRLSLFERLKRPTDMLWGPKIKYLDRRPENDGMILCHGHTHSLEKFKKNMINVCADAWEYAPIQRSELEKHIQRLHSQRKRPFLKFFYI